MWLVFPVFVGKAILMNNILDGKEHSMHLGTGEEKVKVGTMIYRRSLMEVQAGTFLLNTLEIP